MKVLDKLDKLAMREKLGISLAMICVFCLLMDQFVVKSIMRRLRQMDSAIELSGKARDYNLRLLAREKEIKAEYERIGNAISRAASSSEAIAGMKAELYDTAKQLGVTISAMNQREVRPRSFCEDYVIEITKFDADMKDLISFLYKIDTASGMTRVVRLTAAPGRTRNSVTGSMLLTKVMIVDDAGTAKTEEPSGAKPGPAATQKP